MKSSEVVKISKTFVQDQPTATKLVLMLNKWVDRGRHFSIAWLTQRFSRWRTPFTRITTSYISHLYIISFFFSEAQQLGEVYENIKYKMQIFESNIYLYSKNQVEELSGRKAFLFSPTKMIIMIWPTQFHRYIHFIG